jgi:hypothetical protein
MRLSRLESQTFGGARKSSSSIRMLSACFLFGGANQRKSIRHRTEGKISALPRDGIPHQRGASDGSWRPGLHSDRKHWRRHAPKSPIEGPSRSRDHALFGRLGSVYRRCLATSASNPHRSHRRQYSRGASLRPLHALHSKGFLAVFFGRLASATTLGRSLQTVSQPVRRMVGLGSLSTRNGPRGFHFSSFSSASSEGPGPGSITRPKAPSEIGRRPLRSNDCASLSMVDDHR